MNASGAFTWKWVRSSGDMCSRLSPGIFVAVLGGSWQQIHVKPTGVIRLLAQTGLCISMRFAVLYGSMQPEAGPLLTGQQIPALL